MRKFTTLSSVLLALHFLACLIPAEGLLIAKSCISKDVCENNECCLASSGFDGKREIVNYCTPRGQVGSRCYVNNEQLVNLAIYYKACPCADNLECQGNGQIEMPIGEEGVCTA